MVDLVNEPKTERKKNLLNFSLFPSNCCGMFSNCCATTWVGVLNSLLQRGGNGEVGTRIQTELSEVTGLTLLIFRGRLLFKFTGGFLLPSSGSLSHCRRCLSRPRLQTFRTLISLGGEIWSVFVNIVVACLLLSC